MTETEIPTEIQPPPSNPKTTREQIVHILNVQIAQLQSRIESIKQVPGLDDLDLKASLWGSSIDFDMLAHKEVIAVIRAIGGRWEKTPSNESTRIDYSTTIDGQTIRCYAGEPPPNCRIEEVDEIIPAQPQRIKKRKKLVCKETVTLATLEIDSPPSAPASVETGVGK